MWGSIWHFDEGNQANFVFQFADVKFATGPVGQTAMVNSTGYMPGNEIAVKTPDLLGAFYARSYAADEIAAAEAKLRDYIAVKYTPKRRVRHIDDIPLADVLSIYLDAQLDKLHGRFNVDSESEDTIPAIRKFKKRIERLNEWWGAKMLGEVSGEACRAYTKKRRNKGGARRDLEDLRAAVTYHAAEGYHREIVKISLPEKGQPRDKWLTRGDAAKLIWTSWRYREMQKRSRRPMEDEKAPTSKRPLRHLARFILLGIYSGTRAGAIAAASPIPALGRSYVDLERGRYYRLKQGSAKTNKRQPTVPIPFRLLAHLRPWHRIDPEAKHLVAFNGKPVTSSRRRSRVLFGSQNSVPEYPGTRCDTQQRHGSCRRGRSVAGRRLSWDVT